MTEKYGLKPIDLTEVAHHYGDMADQIVRLQNAVKRLMPQPGDPKTPALTIGHLCAEIRFAIREIRNPAAVFWESRLANRLQAALAAEGLAKPQAPGEPYRQGPGIIGYARRQDLDPLLDEAMPGGSHISIGLDHRMCWAEEPPYRHLVPLYTTLPIGGEANQAPEYPRVEYVLAHQHTCASCKEGEEFGPCDCGAVVDGKSVPAPKIKDTEFTVFVRASNNIGTTFITTVTAGDAEEAKLLDIGECQEAWGDPEDRLTVIGVAEGDVKILEWEDIE